MNNDQDALPLTGGAVARRLRPRPKSWPASSIDHSLAMDARPREGVCPGCDGAGYYTLAVPVQHPDFGKLFPCGCQEERLRRQRLERSQVVLAQLAEDLGRLADASFATFDLERPLRELSWAEQTFSVAMQRQALKHALHDAQTYAERPSGWLYLCGPCGAGKSHLATAIANTLAAMGWGVTYASVPDLLRFLRRGIVDGEADARLDALRAVDLLILDDIGAEYLTPWAEEQLFLIANARYLTEQVTILTANDRLEALPARMASRIAEQAHILWLPVSDYRQIHTMP